MREVHIVDGEVVTGDGQQQQEHQEKTATELMLSAQTDASAWDNLTFVEVVIADDPGQYVSCDPAVYPGLVE